MRRLVHEMLLDDRGLETVEYAVMTALIMAAVVTAIGALTLAITERFDAVTAVVGGVG